MAGHQQPVTDPPLGPQGQFQAVARGRGGQRVGPHPHGRRIEAVQPIQFHERTHRRRARNGRGIHAHAGMRVPGAGVAFAHAGPLQHGILRIVVAVDQLDVRLDNERPQRRALGERLERIAGFGRGAPHRGVIARRPSSLSIRLLKRPYCSQPSA